jgi:hypothetical protein
MNTMFILSVRFLNKQLTLLHDVFCGILKISCVLTSYIHDSTVSIPNMVNLTHYDVKISVQIKLSHASAMFR